MIEYVHTGNVTLQPRTLLGVMNAADYYGLEELKRACNGFVQQGCITVDTVCALLSSAEKYIQYKCTKSLVQKVLEFVDEHGKGVYGGFFVIILSIFKANLLILYEKYTIFEKFVNFLDRFLILKIYLMVNFKQFIKFFVI